MRSCVWPRHERATKARARLTNYCLSSRYLQIVPVHLFIGSYFSSTHINVRPQVANFSSMEETAADVEEKSVREWDDIIPEEQRRKIEEEEKQREMEDIFMLPRSRSSNKRVSSRSAHC